MQYTLVNSNSNIELINSADGYSVANYKATKISYTNDYSYGSGNIWSNLEDMIKWSKNLLNPKVGNRD